MEEEMEDSAAPVGRTLLIYKVYATVSQRETRPWTEDDDRFIANNPGFDDVDLMILLDRSYRLVHPRRLSILVRTHRLTEEEADSLYVPMTGMPRHRRQREHARSVRSNLIQHDDDKVAHNIPMKLRHWREEEDELILTSGLPDRQIAARIGRTVGAIRTRRGRLRKDTAAHDRDILSSN